MKLSDILNRIQGPGGQRLVLELDLARGLLEVRPTNPLKAFQLVNATSLHALRENLHAARRDDRVVGLVVHAAQPQQPAAVMDEVGELIEAFGADKPTVAWAESFGELGNALSAYKLASAAQQVWLQPTGELGIGGAELDIVLLKGLLNKVGVEPQFGQRKEYKTAGDQFAADHVTEPNREMVQEIARSVVDDAVATIARRRRISQEQVWQGVNNSPLSAEQALELGLVDRLGYRDEVYAQCFKDWDAEPENLRFVSRYEERGRAVTALRKRRAPKVAVVTLRGGIVTGRGTPAGPGGESVGSDVVDEQFRAALRDDDVKAILFEIDSPGGSAVASDFIRRSVLRARESGRPVVARMGAVAASGGYYAAMGCDEIVAEPTTLTGSIGVVGGKFVTTALYEKLGLVREPVRVGERAGFLSSATEFTQQDWDKLNESLDRIYHTFTSLAAKDRGLAPEALERVARGRVWTGSDAHERGLVDHVGGWRLAWERACSLAGLDPDAARESRIGQPGLLERLRPVTSSESRSTGAVASFSADELLARAAAWLGLPVLGALSLPFRIDLR